MKCIWVGRGEVKLFLFVDNMIICTEKSYRSTENLLEQMTKFSNFPRSIYKH